MITFSSKQLNVIKALSSLDQWRKLSNYVLVETQKASREECLGGYPYWMVIDPANVCNLNCPFCPTGQKRNSRPKSFLSFDSFQKIADELGPYLIHIDFCNWGEPLLNSDISKMITYAKKFNIDTKVDTNLNQLTEQEIEDLILSGLDKLIVSIDGATPHTYSKYRVGGNFYKVMDNLKLLLKKRNQLGRHNPYISWQFLVFRHNEHEIEEVKKIGQDMGVDHVGISKAFIGYKDWIPLNPEYSNYNYQKVDSPSQELTSEFFNDPPDKFCDWPWEAIVINANGSISPCCSVEDEKDDFGNMLKNPFKQIWNNEKYTAARRFIRDKVTPTADNNICIGCKHLGLINFDVLSCHSLFSRDR